MLSVHNLVILTVHKVLILYTGYALPVLPD